MCWVPLCHQYGVGSRPTLYIKKKGELDLQPQVIKFTSCLHMVGGSFPGTPASSTTKTGRHDKVEILLKVGLHLWYLLTLSLNVFSLFHVGLHILSEIMCNDCPFNNLP
jgi:hypothetical protein